VALYYSVLQCTVSCSVLHHEYSVLQCKVCCSVLVQEAVCCIILQCITVYGELQCVAS